MQCPDCGSKNLTWNYSKKGQVQDGLHRLHEVQVDLFRGCDECSATVFVISLDDYLQQLNEGYEARDS